MTSDDFTKCRVLVRTYVVARRSHDSRNPHDKGFMEAVQLQIAKDGLMDFFPDGSYALTEKGRNWPGSMTTT